MWFADVALRSVVDLEWKVIYIGSAESEQYDQVLDDILVGPINVGTKKFVFQVQTLVVRCVRSSSNSSNARTVQARFNERFLASICCDSGNISTQSFVIKRFFVGICLLNLLSFIQNSVCLTII